MEKPPLQRLFRMDAETLFERQPGWGASCAQFLVLVSMLLWGTACRNTSPSSATKARTESVEGDPNRFPHIVHTSDDPRMLAFRGRGLVCQDCHPQKDVEAGRAPRPGGNEHAPCDECHKEEFYREPGDFCLTCHTSVNLTQEGATKMQPFPARASHRVLASNFSHQVHTDSDRLEKKVGFHLSCDDCHKRDASTGDPLLPRHDSCVRCHNEKNKLSVQMGQCESCHLTANLNVSRGRVFITTGLIFQHGDHVSDRQGTAIGCDSCHAAIRESESSEDVSVPLMQECAKCHQDPARTPERVRIARCGICHQDMVEGNPPRTHLSGSSLPETHSLEFRGNHAEQAADKDANCQYCHENLSGSSRDSCFQCHEVMRPRDHMLGWRNDTHGREAAADRDRCATCHTADYCTACHSIVPSSHQPLGAFSRGGHAQSAQFGLSSCMACHTFEDTCSRCHRGQR